MQWRFLAQIHFVAGFADVDAITIGMSKMAQAGADIYASVIVILLAVFSNTLTKSGATVLRGSKELIKIVLISYLTLTVIGFLYILLFFIRF